MPPYETYNFVENIPTIYYFLFNLENSFSKFFNFSSFALDCYLTNANSVSDYYYFALTSANSVSEDFNNVFTLANSDSNNLILLSEKLFSSIQAMSCLSSKLLP